MNVRTCCIVLAALIASACSGKEECRETEYVPGARATLTALTYNTALGPGMVRYSSPRSPELIAALADEPFDLLCLQEVWTQEDSDTVAALFEGMGLHVLRADTRGLNENPADRCEPGMLDPAIECAERECAGWSDEDITLCALKRCASTLASLLARDQGCVICGATSAGHSLEEIEERCTTGSSSRVQDGGNGVLLVSKYPLSDTETLHLQASYANRVAQIARVDLPTGPVQVACTHISASQALPPLQSEYAWWTEEKEAQIAAISERLDERAGCGPQILMGDLNTSRDNGPLVESSRSVYDLAESEGFDSPAATWSPPVCSSCAENTFKGDDSDSRLIDHVMVRTGDATSFEAVSVERTMDWTVVVEDQGNPIETSLADHFAIRIAFDVSTKP